MFESKAEGIKCVKLSVKQDRQWHTLSTSEADLHFVGIPSDSQGLVCSSGHGVILNHYHLHSCSLLQGYNQTEEETTTKELPGEQNTTRSKKEEILAHLKEQDVFFVVKKLKQNYSECSRSHKPCTFAG